MAHLQEEYQKREQEEMERRKPVGVKVGSYMEYRVKSEPGDCPPGRTGHTMTQVGTMTYLIGGSVNGQTKVRGLTSCRFDLAHWTYLKEECGGLSGKRVKSKPDDCSWLGRVCIDPIGMGS